MSTNSQSRCPPANGNEKGGNHATVTPAKSPEAVPSCCCEQHCRCTRRPSPRRFQWSRQDPSNEAWMRDAPLAGRHCIYCVPEQAAVNDMELRQRQQHCHEARTSECLRRAILNRSLCPPVSCCGYACYRSNVADMLRRSNNQAQQRAVEKEYGSRRLALQEELQNRRMLMASRRRKNEHLYMEAALLQDQAADACPCGGRCCRRGRPINSVERRRDVERGQQRDASAPPCHPSHRHQRGPTPPPPAGHRRRSLPPTPRTEPPPRPCHHHRSPSPPPHLRHDGSPTPMPTHRGMPGNCHADDDVGPRRPPPPQRGHSPTFSSTPCHRHHHRRICPCCGGDLIDAAAVVSMIAAGQWKPSLSCARCGFTGGFEVQPPGNHRAEGDAAGDGGCCSGAVEPRSGRVSSGLMAPAFGRKIFITDDAYLQRRSQLLLAWEEEGVVRRVASRSHRASAALPQKAVKWLTTDSPRRMPQASEAKQRAKAAS